MRSIFEASALESPQQIIDDLSAAADAWTDGEAPNDDITFVVLRIK